MTKFHQVYRCKRCNQAMPPRESKKTMVGNWCQKCKDEHLGGMVPQKIVGSYFDASANMVVRKLAPADALGWLYSRGSEIG